MRSRGHRVEYEARTRLQSRRAFGRPHIISIRTMGRNTAEQRDSADSLLHGITSMAHYALKDAMRILREVLTPAVFYQQCVNANFPPPKLRRSGPHPPGNQRGYRRICAGKREFQ